MKKFSTLLAVLGIFALIIGAGTIIGCSHTAPVPANSATSGPTNDTKTTTYYCPMHPDVVQNTPGKCPKCGMDLVEKTN